MSQTDESLETFDIESGDEPQMEASTQETPAAEESVVQPAAPVEQNLDAPIQQPEDAADPMDALRKQVSDLMGQVAQYKQKELETPSQAAAPGEAPSPLQQVAPGQVSQLDFFQGEDHVAILEDPAKLNALLNKVATVAFNAAVNASEERVMRRIPSIVSSSAQQQMAIGDVTRDFYAANQDLVNFKQAVSMAAMQIYQENPNLQLPELLSQAAARTREILHLKGIDPGRKRVPAQPAGNSVRGGVDRLASDPQLSEQQKQIADLLDF